MTVRTDNDFLLASDGRSISPLMPIVITTQEQALRTAAWLVAMSPVLEHEPDPDGNYPTFDDVYAAVCDT